MAVHDITIQQGATFAKTLTIPDEPHYPHKIWCSDNTGGVVFGDPTNTNE